MELYNITNQTTGTEQEFRNAFPNTSFPEILLIDTLEEFGYKPVLESPQLSCQSYERVVRDGVTIDANDNVVKKWKVIPMYTEYVDEDDVVHTVQEQIDAHLARDAEAHAAEARNAAKLVRQAAVDAIKVTTSTGKIFDGDETSQTRMARAIIALQAMGVPTVTWVLADNTSTQATVAELVEALALAGAAQANIWVIS
jgi:hypothetical protein